LHFGDYVSPNAVGSTFGVDVRMRLTGIYGRWCRPAKISDGAGIWFRIVAIAIAIFVPKATFSTAEVTFPYAGRGLVVQSTRP
jgi:hypothetical protein